MPTLSSFQTLPLLVVDLIVDYVVGGSRLQRARVATDKFAAMRLLQPLLSVCHSFHAAVQPRIFNRFVLDLKTPGNQTDIQNTSQSISNGPSAHLVAKDLVINVDLISVSSGGALELLSRASYDNCIFPAVRSLTFNCNFNLLARQEDSAIDPAMVDANATAFSQRLRQMAPKAHKLVVSDCDVRGYSQSSIHHLRFLVRVLMRLVDHLEYNTGLKDHRVIPNFDGICNLVRIDCMLSVGAKSFYQLARQCARSLRSLTLRHLFSSREPMDISELIRYPDSSPVEYSSLQKLKLETWIYADSVQRPTFAGAIPFPILRDLCIIGAYPFGDDTPFRGNAAILERLYSDLTQSLANVLKASRVFAYASHPQLRRVTTIGTHRIVPNGFANDADCLQFMLSIGSDASTRVISRVSYSQNTPRILSLLEEHTMVQNLELSHARLVLWDVIALIKSLPLLLDLTTGEPRIGTRPAGHSKARLPKYVIDHYAPVGERFRSWSFPYLMRKSEATECVLLLALVCPNFNYVVPNGRGDTRRLVSEIKEFIATRAYKKHEQRFQRLLDFVV